MSKYGEVENLNVCDNTSDHMVGNVYVKFREEEEAVAAMTGLAGRFYGGAFHICSVPISISAGTTQVTPHVVELQKVARGELRASSNRHHQQTTSLSWSIRSWLSAKRVFRCLGLCQRRHAVPSAWRAKSAVASPSPLLRDIWFQPLVADGCGTDDGFVGVRVCGQGGPSWRSFRP
jgi:hypothetical protein